MTIRFVRNHQAINNKVAGTNNMSLTVDATNAVVGGNVLIASISFDNTGTSTPTVSSIAVPSGETASWVQLASADSPQATSAGAIRTEIWGIKTTQGWAAATAVAVTLSASVTAKACVMQEFFGASLNLRGTAGSGTSTAGTPSAATSGTALVAGDLVIGAAGIEGATNFTTDTDTTNGSWSTILGAITSGGGGATNCGVVQQYKIVTATGVQTYNPGGGSGDTNAAVVALQPASPVWEELANGAAQGTAVSTTNSSLTGIAAGGTMTYETAGTTAPNGSRYFRFAVSAGNGTSGKLGLVKSDNQYHFVRFYFRASAATPGTLVNIMKLYDNAGAANRMRIDLQTTGAIVIRDADTTRATSSKTLANYEWVRIEVRINVTGTAMALRLYWGANLHGTTADEEITGLTWTDNVFDEFRFGPITNYTGNLDFDALAYDNGTAAGGWIGPVSVNANEAVRLIDGSLSVALSNTAAGTVVNDVAGTLAVALSNTADATVTSAGVQVDGSLAVGMSNTAAATVVNDVAGSLAVSTSGSAAALMDRAATASLPVSMANTADATVVNDVAGTLAVALSNTAAATVVNDIAGSLVIGLTNASAAEVIRAASGSLAVAMSNSAAAQVDRFATAALTVALSNTGTVTADRFGSGTLPISAPGTAAATVTRAATGSLAIGVGLSAAATVTSANVTAVLDVALTLAAAATVDNSVDGSLAVAMSNTAAATVVNDIAAPLSVAMSNTAAASVVNDVAGTLPITTTGAAAAQVDNFADAALSVAMSNAAAASATKPVQGALTVSMTNTAAMTRVVSIDGSLAVGMSNTGAVASALSVDGALTIGVLMAAAAANPSAVPTLGQLWPRGG